MGQSANASQPIGDCAPTQPEDYVPIAADCSPCDRYWLQCAVHTFNNCVSAQQRRNHVRNNYLIAPTSPVSYRLAANARLYSRGMRKMFDMLLGAGPYFSCFEFNGLQIREHFESTSSLGWAMFDFNWNSFDFKSHCDFE